MFSVDELKSLINYEPIPDSPVLSVYLDTDLAESANVKRGFQVVLKNMLRDITRRLDRDKLDQFDADAKQVTDFLHEYRDPAKGVIFFSDASEGLFRVRELRVKVPNLTWWNDAPEVRPLTEMLDEHARYGLVLADRTKSRMFTIFLGEIEEAHEAFAPADIPHTKSPGQDHAFSQMQIERKSDLHARWHLKHVAELMSRIARKFEFDRLILAGPVEATSELQELLPKQLRNRIVDRIHLPIEATKDQVLEETLKVDERIERAREVDLVSQVVTAAKKGREGTLGLGDTLLALEEKRVLRLVYSHDFTVPGFQCTNCGALYVEARNTCDYCGKPVSAVDDLMELTAKRTIEMRAVVEPVYDQAAARLKTHGNVGALLRF
jgi:peptide chain release factor subunit 1